jgi:predicted metal-dependent hydrolase
LEILTGSRLHPTEIREDRIILSVREHASIEHREKAMNDLYRSELKAKGLPLVERWERTIGVKTNAVGIKNMRTRWGTCNTIDKRVWLNLQLARFPEHCLEYVVVHELVHLLVKNHGPIFKDYMDRYLPDWRERKHEIRMGLERP